MRPPRRILGFGSALVLSAACSTHRGPSIPLLFGDKADPTTGCAVSSGTDDRLSNVNRIRVTLRSRNDDGSTRDFCDSLFNFPGTPPYLRLSGSGADKVDIYVEAFATTSGGDGGAGGVQRVATGTLPGVSPSEDNLGSMRLFPTEDFRCEPNQTTLGRAFHTATLLPDGRVLFIGGLIANEMDPTDKTFAATGATATDQAELWDPRTQALTLVNDAATATDMGSTADLSSTGDMAGPTDAGAPTITYRPGRAFHSAVLLSTSGPCAANDYAVLVVGGFSPETANGPIFAGGELGLPGSRLQPFAGNSLLPLHAASNEVFCLDPTTNKATHVPITGAPLGFRASTVGPNGFVIAGGNDFDSSNDTTFPAGDLDVFPLGGGTVLDGDTASHRLGASLTTLPDGQALLWGGGEYTDPPGELLGELATAPYGAALTVPNVTPTQFQTATLLTGTATPSVLVTGGFEVLPTAVDTQPPIAGNAVRVLSVVDGIVTPSIPPFGTNATSGANYPSVAQCYDPTRYRPAGYESAVALDRGRVLITGGAPSTESITSHCTDCPDDGPILTLCALGQASLYEGGQIVPAAAMQVPRFGHTSTVLPDGTILIAGGVGQRASSGGQVETRFVSDLEVYNPRTTTPPSGTDTDDPIADVLAADKLTRAPAEQAVDPAKPTKPAKSCGTL